MLKIYSTFTLLFALLCPLVAQGQSELFAEKANADFITKVQPGLLTKAADPKTSPYDFMILCKQLGVYGDRSSAAVVAKSLGNPARSLSARTALQAMPFPEAGDELRNSLGIVGDPVLKAGVIGSLGMRRDAKSVPILLPLLESEEPVLVEAAMFALARIALPSYREAVTSLLGNSDFARAKKYADLNLMYGEFLRINNHADEAQRVFEAVLAKAPRDYHKEAACFQILLRDSESTRKLAAQWLAGDDPVRYRAVLRASRFIRNDAMADMFIQALKKCPVERKPALLAALGDQKNSRGQALLLESLGSTDEAEKKAAMDALKAFADRASVKSLIAAAITGDEKFRRDSITVISMFEDDVNGDILALLKQDDAHKGLGVELIAARRMITSRNDVFSLAKSGSPAVRPVAIRALGELAESEHFAWLADLASDPAAGALGEAAKVGLKSACGVVFDKVTTAKKLAEVAKKLKGQKTDRLYFFELLAMLGGSTARAAVAQAALADDQESRDLATRVLGTWMDPDVAPILLSLANTPGYPYANRALRGYLRLARQFAMPKWLRCAMVRDALASPACKEGEKKITDIIIKQYGLDLSVPETDDQKLLRNIELDQAVYGVPGEPDKFKVVTDKVRGKMFNSEKTTIVFEGGYNKFFEGDPAPGIPKKLQMTFRFRDSGKFKTVTVGENSNVVLPRE